MVELLPLLDRNRIPLDNDSQYARLTLPLMELLGFVPAEQAAAAAQGSGASSESSSSASSGAAGTLVQKREPYMRILSAVEQQAVERDRQDRYACSNCRYFCVFFDSKPNK
jgi:hypothetical protein